MLFFGPARTAAGTGRAEIDAPTVAALLGLAAARLGPELGAVLARASVWVNGEPAARERALAPGDEVAIVPPVSGGC